MILSALADLGGPEHRTFWCVVRNDEIMQGEFSPPVRQINPTRHIVVSVAHLEELEYCLGFDEDVVAENNAIVTAIRHQRL